MLDVDSCAAAYADRLRLDSPGMAWPPPAASHQAGLGGRRNMDLGALAMPLEAGRGAGLGSPARVSLEDERSERRRARALLSWVVARPRPRAAGR